ncbi:MAG: hypothetical protein JF606_23260 [Burkholderiales bacterium]|nr:hypothetical protein [Burkholderiales bacterium]
MTSTGDDDRVEDPNPRFMQIGGTSANCPGALAQSKLSCDGNPNSTSSKRMQADVARNVNQESAS